jgi:transcriptional regulator with XRE-family HTH domain
MTFPERLRITIEKSGLSRDEFAALTGVSRSQIFNYLKGSSEPSLSFFQNLEEHFPEVDVHWLITGQRACVGQEAQVGYGWDDIRRAINRMLDEMDLESKKDVLKYVSDKKLLMELLAAERRRKDR